MATTAEKGALREIKEWQALMDHLRRLPVKKTGELPVFPLDERAAEVNGDRGRLSSSLRRRTAPQRFVH